MLTRAGRAARTARSAALLLFCGRANEITSVPRGGTGTLDRVPGPGHRPVPTPSIQGSRVTSGAVISADWAAAQARSTRCRCWSAGRSGTGALRRGGPARCPAVASLVFAEEGRGGWGEVRARTCYRQRDSPGRLPESTSGVIPGGRVGLRQGLRLAAARSLAHAAPERRKFRTGWPRRAAPAFERRSSSAARTEPATSAGRRRGGAWSPWRPRPLFQQRPGGVGGVWLSEARPGVRSGLGAWRRASCH